MPPFVLSVLLGIMSAFFGALTSILAKQILKTVRTQDFLTINFLVLFMTLLPFAPLGFQISYEAKAIATIILAASIDALGNYLFFKSFELNDAVTASTLISLSPIFTLFLAPVLSPNSFNLQVIQTLGIVIIVIGITLVSRYSSPDSLVMSPTSKRLRGLIFPSLTAVIFGGNVHLIKYLFNQHYANPYSYYLFRVLMISLITYAIFNPDHRWMTSKNLYITWVRALCVLAQWMLLLHALKIGDPAIVKAVSDSSPLFVILIVLFLFKEKLSRKTIFGSLLITLGILMVSLFPAY